MTVNIRQWSPQARRTPFNFWEDDFGVSGQTVAEIRLNYAHYGFNFETQAIGANSGLVLQGIAIGATRFCHWVPLQVGGVLSQNQFSEAVIEATSGAARGGLGVMITADNNEISATGGVNHGYVLSTIAETNTMALQSVLNGVITTLVSPVCGLAAGDLMALSATINPADVTLEVFRNNILEDTIVDNAAGRFQTGLPTFWGRQNTVVSLEFGFFRCGTLTRF